MARDATAKVLPFPKGKGYGDRAANDDQADDDIDSKLTKRRKEYESYLDAKANENREMAQGRRYYHGVQWDAEELETLKARNQPPITFNRISRKINGIVGLIEKLRQEPKAYPRTPSPGAQDGAELATQVLRYAVDVTDFQELSPEASRHCAIGGLSGVELVISQGDQGDPDLDLVELDQREFFYDPRSTKADFSDARFMGTAKWIDLEVAQDMWPDHEEELEGYVDNDSQSDTLWRGDERKPEYAWTNSSQKRLRVVDHWYLKGGKWLYCIYCGDLELEKGESPFVDEKGKSVCKYLPFSCNVDHENDRYGFYRDLKGPQDEVNHRRSKALHLLNTRRVNMEAGAVDDIELLRREVARPDGVVIRNKGYELEVDPGRDDDFQGNVSMLQEAKQELENYGPSPALLGASPDQGGPMAAQSGRAIKLLQAAGIAELGPFILAWRKWKRRVYRALWNAIQQFWTKERWIRVTDSQELEQFIQVNGWQQDEYGRPAPIHQLASLDVDIIIDEGPDSVTVMQDAFDMLLALAQNGASIPPEAIIELANLPSSIKKAIVGQIGQAQAPNPMQQQAAQIKLAQEQAKVPKLQSEAQLNAAKAQAVLMPKEGGPQQQIDTPADQAKAELDLAKARQLHQQTDHELIKGPELPAHMQPSPAPATKQKSMSESALDFAKAQQAQAHADRLNAETNNPELFHPPPAEKSPF